MAEGRISAIDHDLRKIAVNLFSVEEANKNEEIVIGDKPKTIFTESDSIMIFSAAKFLNVADIVQIRSRLERFDRLADFGKRLPVLNRP